MHTGWKDSVFSFVRILLCILLATVWVLYLIKSPGAREQKQEIVNQSEPITTSKKESSVLPTVSQVKFTPLIPQHMTPKEELPRLVNLALVQDIDKHSKKRTEQKIKSENQNNSKQFTEAMLRKEIPLKKGIFRPLLQNLNKVAGLSTKDVVKTSSEISWLPRYLLETKEMVSGEEQVANNLNLIASQLELLGLIHDPTGEGAAIIRNVANNQIKILKKGDKYNELKLLEINKDEVILGNQGLSKTYVKKIVKRKTTSF